MTFICPACRQIIGKASWIPYNVSGELKVFGSCRCGFRGPIPVEVVLAPVGEPEPGKLPLAWAHPSIHERLPRGLKSVSQHRRKFVAIQWWDLGGLAVFAALILLKRGSPVPSTTVPRKAQKP